MQGPSALDRLVFEYLKTSGRVRAAKELMAELGGGAGHTTTLDGGTATSSADGSNVEESGDRTDLGIDGDDLSLDEYSARLGVSLSGHATKDGGLPSATARQRERILFWGLARVDATGVDHDGGGGGGAEERGRGGDRDENGTVVNGRQTKGTGRYSQGQRLVTSFASLVEWACSSLDLYRPELLLLCWPLFVNTYILLLTGPQGTGSAEAASRFMARWAPAFVPAHESQLNILSRATSASVLKELCRESEFLRRVVERGARVGVSLSSFGLELLTRFLHAGRHFALLALLNDRINITVTSAEPFPLGKRPTLPSPSLAISLEREMMKEEKEEEGKEKDGEEPVLVLGPSSSKTVDGQTNSEMVNGSLGTTSVEDENVSEDEEEQDTLV